MIEKVSYTRPCPVCGKQKGCAIAYPTRGKPFVLCYRVESPYHTELAGYKHFVNGLGDSPVYDDKKPEIASIHRRDLVYTAMLNRITLDVEDYNDLLRRGFDDNEICTNRYASVHNVAEILSKIFVLDNVPGFYKENDQWTMLCPQGFFIPVREFGKITGLQIRLRNPKKGQKYIWFSSNGKEMGAPVIPTLHDNYVFMDKGDLWVCESPLKADFVWYKLRQSVIAVAGVNSSHKLVSQFVSNSNFSKIIIAFDNDWKSNANVRKAVSSLCRKIINDTGSSPKIACWHGEDGIDDALKDGREIEIITFEKWCAIEA
jgi:DNA primase